MGEGRRVWFPLAAPGFAQLVMAVVAPVPAAYERSWFLVAVALVFALVSLVFSTPVTGAPSAAGVLFAAAFAVLPRRPRDTAAGAP